MAQASIFYEAKSIMADAALLTKDVDKMIEVMRENQVPEKRTIEALKMKTARLRLRRMQLELKIYPITNKTITTERQKAIVALQNLIWYWYKKEQKDEKN